MPSALLYCLLRGSRDWRFGLLAALTALVTAVLAIYPIGVRFYFENATLSRSEELLAVLAAALGLMAVIFMERCRTLQNTVDEMQQRHTSERTSSGHHERPRGEA